MSDEHNNNEWNLVSQRLDQIIVSFRETRDDLKDIRKEMATKEALIEHRNFVTGEIKEIKLSLTEQDKVLANQDKALVGVVNEVEKNSGFRNSVIRGRNYVLGAIVVGLITISGGFIAHEQQSGTALASNNVPVTNVFIKPTINNQKAGIVNTIIPPKPDDRRIQSR